MTSLNYASIDGWVPDLVIYHKHCFDGSGAAWACWKRYGDECEYIAADYGDTPPDVTGKNVLIVDFSYKKPVIEELSQKAKTIIILDHHLTAENELTDYIGKTDGNVFVIFNKEKSGAGLAWEFCFPDREVPALINLIEDRDLWKFSFPFTRPFGIYLGTQDFNISTYDGLNEELQDPLAYNKILTSAYAMEKYFDSKVKDFASHAQWIIIGGHRVISVNCPLEFRSEVGNYLVTNYPEADFSATFFDTVGKRKWSLRSNKDRTNVAEVAERFGGGGHWSAAGFTVDIPSYSVV